MTNKAATPATIISDAMVDSYRVDFLVHGFPINHFERENIFARLLHDRATIEAKDKEIERLRNALDELLDWVNGERRISDDRLAEIESMIPSKGEL